MRISYLKDGVLVLAYEGGMQERERKVRSQMTGKFRNRTHRNILWPKATEHQPLGSSLVLSETLV